MTPAQILADMTKSGIIKVFDHGDTIVSEYSYMSAVPIVLQGRVKVIRSDDDRELVLYYLQPGDGCVMSFMAALFNETHGVRMVADAHCEVAFVAIDIVKKTMLEQPALLTYMFQIYHRRFGELLDLVDAVAFRKMDERLFLYLEKKVEMTGSHTLYLTHEQIASELGTAREVVSRLLKQLESKGIVVLSRNKIEIME